MPADRTTTFCPKCNKSYKDKAHLSRCFPDKTKEQCEAEHVAEKRRMMSFTAERIIESSKLKTFMQACMLSMSLYPNLAKMAGLLGHTVVGTDDVITPLIATQMVVNINQDNSGVQPENTRDESIFVTRKPVANNLLVEDGEVPQCSSAQSPAPVPLGEVDDSSSESGVASRLVERSMPAMDAHVSAVHKSVRGGQAAKNVANLVDPSTRPVSLQTAQRAYTDPKVKQDVADAIARAKSSNEKRRSHQTLNDVPANDHRLVTRYLAGAVIQLCHFQRPVVASNLTVEEFALAMEVGDDGERLIAVKNHQMATSNPSCMILSKTDYQLMRDYLAFIRGEMPEDDEPSTSLFFRAPNGKPIQNMSKQLDSLQTGYDIVSKRTAAGAHGYTCNHARKAMDSASRSHFGSNSMELKSVIDYLTHSENVVRKHYARETFSEVMAARQSMLAVVNADGPAVGGAVGSRECHVDASSSSRFHSEADRLDTIYRAIFDARFNDFHSDVPSLSIATDLLRKSGLKPDLLVRFAQRYIAAWRTSRERLSVTEHLQSVTTRPSTNAQARALIETLGLRRMRPGAVLNMAKSMPIPTTRREKQATQQRKSTDSDACLRARVVDQKWPGLVVRDSVGSMGRGVCTTKPFRKGELVCDYNGLVMQGQEARAYIRRSNDDTSIDTSYMYTFKCQDVACVIDVIDEDAYGHMIGRYINHSVTPNLVSKPMFLDGKPVMLFLAAEDILAGTDLSFHYGDRSQSAPEWMHTPTEGKTTRTSKRRPAQCVVQSSSTSHSKEGQIPPRGQIQSL